MKEFDRLYEFLGHVRFVWYAAFLLGCGHSVTLSASATYRPAEYDPVTLEWK